MLVIALTSSSLSPAVGQSVVPVSAPPVSPADSRTTLDVTSGGTPIVNIATPDDAGTSHNVFTALSAGKEGLIFNNSAVVAQSAIGGFLLANPNLANSASAKLILNEVTGGVRTSLAGPIEIFGSEAALVIANPTGISCDGCGFINTSRVSLAAANLAFGPDGRFSGFAVSGGDVSIEGKGLLAGNVDYFDIIAAAAHINASLYARDLVVVGGQGGVDYASRTVGAASTGTGSSGVVIDSSALGGMYANRIRLLGTGQGVGINLAGTVAALDGALSISADGAIRLTKATAAGDAEIVSSRGQLTLDDQLWASGNLDLQAVQITQAGGFAGAQGDVTLRSQGDVSLSGNGVYAGLASDGNLSGSANLALQVAGRLDAGNTVLAAGGSLMLEAGSLRTDAAGTIAGRGVTARVSGAADLAGTISSSADALVSGDAVSLTGSLGANDALHLSGRTVTLSGTATGLAGATAAAQEQLVLAGSGTLQSNGTALLSAPELDLAGNVIGVGAVRLTADRLIATGNARSGGDLAIEANGDADLGGTLSADRSVSLIVAGHSAITGTLLAAGSLDLASGSILLSGAVESGQMLSLSSAVDMITAQGSSLAAGGLLSLSAMGSLALAGDSASNDTITLAGHAVDLSGTIQALGQLSITADTLKASGIAASGGDSTFNIGSVADITGTLSANGKLALTAAQATNAAGARLLAGQALTVVTSATLTQAGTISGKLVSVSADTLTNSGLIVASDDLALAGITRLAQAGTVQAGGTLSLTAPHVLLSGRTIGAANGQGALTIVSPDISFAQSSDLQSGAALALFSSGDLVTAGNILALGAGVLSAEGKLTQGAAIFGNMGFDLGAGAALIQVGSMSAGGPVSLEAATIVNSGTVASNAGLSLKAEGALASTNTLLANGPLALQGATIDLGGTTATNSALVLTAQRVNLSGAASGLTGISTQIADLSLDVGASLQSGSDLNLSLATLENAGLIVAHGPLAVTVSGAFDNAGRIASNGALTLDALSGLASSGLLQAGTDLTAKIAGAGQLAGIVYAGGNALIEGGSLNIIGAATARGKLALASSSLLTLDTGSMLYGAGGIAVNAGDLAAAGAIESGAGLELAARQDLTLDGQTQASEATRLTAGTSAAVTGRLTSGGALTLAAPSIAIPGQIVAGDTVDFTANADSLSLAGTIQAVGNVALTAVNRLVIGTATAPSGSGAGSVSGGSLSGSSGVGAVTAGGSGGVGSSDSAAASALVLDVPALAAAMPGSLSSNGSVTLSAADIDIYGTVAARGDLSALAAHVLTITGSVWADGKLSADVGSLSVGQPGSLAARGPVHIAALGDVANFGSIASNEDALMLTNGGAFAGAGTLYANSALGIASAGDFVSSGTLTADILAISARDVTLSGTSVAATSLSIAGRTISLQADSDTQSADRVILTSSGTIALSGRLLGVIDVTLDAGSDLLFRATSDLQSGGSLSATSKARLEASLGSNIAANGPARFEADRLIINGTLAGNRNLDLTATSLLALGGEVIALGDVAAWSDADLTVTGRLASNASIAIAGGMVSLSNASQLESGSALRLDAASLRTAGTIRASGGINALASGNAEFAGTLLAGATDASGAVTSAADLDLAALGTLSLTGMASATRAGMLKAGVLLVPGTVLALGDVKLDAGALTTAGTITANGTFSAHAGGDVTLGGALTGLSAIHVNGGAALTQAATLGSNGSISLAAADVLTHSGTTRAGGNITVAGRGLALGGTVQSTGLLDLVSGSGGASLAGGSVYVGRDVTLTSDGDASLAGTLAGSASLTAKVTGTLAIGPAGTVQAGTSDASGAITSVGNMLLGAQAGITNAGYIGSTGDLVLNTPALVNTGTISTAADIDLTADTLSLGGTFISLGNLHIATTAGVLDVAGGLEGRNVTLSASGGDLMLGAGSHVSAYGAEGRAQLSSSGSITALGPIAANGDLSLVAGADITVGADRIGSDAALALSSGGTITLQASGALASAGTIASGKAVIVAANSLASTNIYSVDALAITTQGAIDLTGTTWSAESVSLTSSGATLSLGSAARVESGGAIALTAGSDISNSGTILAGTSGASGPDGTVYLGASGVLSSNGGITSGNGNVHLAGGSIVLGGQLATGGGVYAAGSLTLSAPTVTLIAGGEAVAGSDFSYTGSSLTLGEGSLLQSNRSLAVTLGSEASAGAFASSGNLVALGDLSLLVTGGALNNLAGSGIFAGGSGAGASGGSIKLAAASLDNAGIIAASQSETGNGGNLAIAASTIASSGLIHADRVLDIATSSLTVAGSAAGAGLGIVESGSALTLAIPTISLVNGGTVRSAGDITLGAASFAGAGNVLAGGTLGIDAATSLTSSGILAAQGDVRLSGGGALGLDGIVSAAAGKLDLATGGLLNLGPAAAIYASDAITGSADRIIIAAPVDPATAAFSTHGDITLASLSGLTVGGRLIADGSVTLSDAQELTLGGASLVSVGTPQATPSVAASSVALSSPRLTLGGALAATGGLNLTSDSVVVSGTVLANGDITLVGSTSGWAPDFAVLPAGTLASYLRNVRLGTLSSADIDGTLAASLGDLSLAAPGLTLGASGKIAAGHDLSLTMTGGGFDLAGEIAAGNDLVLTGGTLNLASTGALRAGRDLSFTTADVPASGGVIEVNGMSHDLTAIPLSVRVAGLASAVRNLTLTVPGALVLDGTAQLVSGQDLAVTSGPAIIGASFTTDAAGNPAALGVLAGRDLQFSSTGAVNVDGSVQAGRDLNLSALGPLTTSEASALIAGNLLSLSGASLNLAGLNSGAGGVTLKSNGAATLSGATVAIGRIALAADSATIAANGSLTAYGVADNAAAPGRNIGASANIDLTTIGQITNQGTIWSDGLVFLKSASADVVNDASAANGGMTANTIVVQVDSGSFIHQGGAFKADNVGLFMGGDFTNAGSFAANGNYWISAANITNSGLMAGSGNLLLDASGNLVNTGTIYAGSALTFNVAGTLTNDYVGDDPGNGSHGLLLAQGDITVSAHDVVNQSATIQSLGGNVGITLTGGNLTNTIKTLAVGEAPGTGSIAEAGVGPIAFEASMCGTFVRQHGTTYFHYVCPISLRPGDMVIRQTVINYAPGMGYDTTDEVIFLYGSQVSPNNVSEYPTVIATGNPTIGSAANQNTGTATIAAAGDLTIAAGAGNVTNRNSAMLAGGNVAITTTGTVSNTADLQASGGTSSSIPGAPTVIQAGGTVAIAAGTFSNTASNQVVQNSPPGSSAPSAPATGSSTGIAAQANTATAAVANTMVPGTGGTPAMAGGSGAGGTYGYGLTGAGSGSTLSLSLARGGGISITLAARSDLTLVEGGGALIPLIGAAVEADAGQSAAAVTLDGLAGGGSGVAATSLTMARLDAGAGSGAGSGLVVGGLNAFSISSPAGALATGADVVAPLSADIVTAFNGLGLQSLSNQSFGTFLGGFLAAYNLTSNAPGLFTFSANPDSAYLFTSNAALASEAALYDSSWFFARVAPDRATNYTRLGDGFFEALLVSRQVQAASGLAQLKAYGSALDQYEGLLTNAASQKDRLGLSLGIALSEAQVAELAEPILWYVSAEVSGRQVLVPVLYMAASDQKALAAGALVAGDNVLVSASGKITNGNTISARSVAALAAGGTLVNAKGGVIAGGSVVASAAQDILLAGGSTIAANGSGNFVLPGGAQVPGGLVALSAGGNITSGVVTATSVTTDASRTSARNWSSTVTSSQSLTGAFVSSSAATQLSAGNSIALDAARLASGGATSLVAGQDVLLGGSNSLTSQSYASQSSKYVNARGTETQSTFVGTEISSAGPIAIAALDGTVAITGGTIKTTDPLNGDISLYGGQGVGIAAGQNTATLNLFEQTGKRSTVTTTSSGTSNSLATIGAAGSLSVESPAGITVEGGLLTADGALSVNAGSLAIMGVTDQTDTTVATWTKKKGLLSSKVTRTNTETIDQSIVGSVLSGDTVDVATTAAADITASSVVASNGLAIQAGGPVTIGTMAESDSFSQTISVKKSGFSVGGSGLFVGVAKSNTTSDITSTTNVGSLVGSESGTATILSGDMLSLSGSTVAAGGDVLMAGKSIDIAHALNITDIANTSKSSSIGVSIGVQSQLIQSGANLLDAAKIASSVGNDRVTAVAGLAGGMAAVNSYETGKNLVSAIENGGALGATATISFGISKARSADNSHDETVLGTQVSGTNVALVATGQGEQGSIRVTGSQISAANDLLVSAVGPVTIAAAQENDSTSGNAKSSGFNIAASVTFGADKNGFNAGGPTVSAGVSSAKSNFGGSDVTQIESGLAAGGAASIVTPGALTIDGSTVSGERLVVDAGSLLIASRQDSSVYDASSKSTSLGASLNLATGQASVSGNRSNGKQSGDFASVETQAGLYAGTGGFDITVAGHSDLKGAVIASEADAAQNSLVTGTLSASSIENREHYSASQLSMGASVAFATSLAPAAPKAETAASASSNGTAGTGTGTGTGTGAAGADRKGQVDPNGATPLPGVQVANGVSVTSGVPVALSAGDSQSSTTLSAIAPGAITIRSGDAASQSVADTISRDTGSNGAALTQAFTQEKRSEIAQGFAAAQILATETNAFLAAQAARAEQWTQDNQQADPATNPYAIWASGGTGRLVLTALNGAAGSDVSGSLAGLVQASAVNVLQGLATAQVKQIADNLGSETARAALQAVVGCAGSAAGGAGDCAGAALGAATSVVLNTLVASLDERAPGSSVQVDAQGNPVRTYTQEEQQARINLVGTLVGAIADSAGLDVQAAVTAAQIETQGNAVSTIKGPGGAVTICTAGEQTCADAHPFSQWKTGTEAERARWAAFAAQYEGASDQEIADAMERYYRAIAVNINDPAAPVLTEAEAIALARQESAARADIADRIEATIASNPSRRAELEGMTQAERDTLARIAMVEPELTSALLGQSQAVRALVYQDLASGRGDDLVGQLGAGVLSTVLSEDTMLALYLANASERVGERKGAFDEALQGGRELVLVQEMASRAAADAMAARMAEAGTPQAAIDAYVIEEYFTAAMKREAGIGLLDQAQFLGDYLADPGAMSEATLKGIAQGLDGIFLDDKSALQHLTEIGDGVVDFANADIRAQAITLGNGAGKAAVAAVDAVIAKGASTVGGRVVDMATGETVSLDAPKIDPVNPAPGGANAPERVPDVPEGIPYFRVQGGGSGNATSRSALTVNSDGSVSIAPGCTGSICVSIGTADHAAYYLSNRRPDGSVVVFEVDRGTHNKIMENLLPQEGNSGASVKLTDASTPGISIELNQAYSELMVRGSSNARILTQEEFINEFGRNK